MGVIAITTVAREARINILGFEHKKRVGSKGPKRDCGQTNECVSKSERGKFCLEISYKRAHSCFRSVPGDLEGRTLSILLILFG
jgi:hypothetical protein